METVIGYIIRPGKKWFYFAFICQTDEFWDYSHQRKIKIIWQYYLNS